MDNATTTDVIPVETPPVDNQTPTDQVSSMQSDIMLPLEQSSFSSSFGTSTSINTIVNEYFNIFPTSYLLLIVAIGICSLLIYTLYSYLDNQ